MSETNDALETPCHEWCGLDAPHDGPCIKDVGREAFEKGMDRLVDAAVRCYNRTYLDDDAYWAARRALIALYVAHQPPVPEPGAESVPKTEPAR